MCYKGVQDQHKKEFLTRVVCLAGITQCIIGGDYWRKDDVMSLSCAEKSNMTNGCFYREDGSFDYCMCTGNLCNGYCPCNSSSTIAIPIQKSCAERYPLVLLHPITLTNIVFYIYYN